MKAIEMSPMVTYRVTKGSSDTSLEIGDLVWLSENGKLNVLAQCGGGWLDQEEWRAEQTCDFEVEKVKGKVEQDSWGEKASFFIGKTQYN